MKIFLALFVGYVSRLPGNGCTVRLRVHVLCGVPIGWILGLAEQHHRTENRCIQVVSSSSETVHCQRFFHRCMAGRFTLHFAQEIQMNVRLQCCFSPLSIAIPNIHLPLKVLLNAGFSNSSNAHFRLSIRFSRKFLA